jgi:hypothetical protein
MQANPYGPRTTQRLGIAGVWTAPIACPTIMGILGADPVAVRVGETVVERLDMNPVTGAPRETTDALIARATALHGIVLPFWLIYEGE